MSRPRLLERLDGYANSSAILVSAPAGYGKTTLVNDWVESRSEPCAWLSLDRLDNEFERFVEHVLYAIELAVPNACSNTQRLWSESELTSAGSIASSLVDELEEVEFRFYLVLDDLDAVTSEAVSEFLDGLLEHPSSSLCLVLCTRQDPPLALSRWRARGWLSDLGVTDLEFDRTETEAWLRTIPGLELDSTATERLEETLRGWAVGMRTVVSVLKRHPDPSGFLANYSAGPRSAERYLVDEVLARQCSCVRESIYRASILDRFDRSLFEAVSGPLDCVHLHGREAESGRELDSIQRLFGKGLFLLPLDDEGGWYRFHPMFRSLLQDHLETQVDRETLLELHRRACVWLESAGQVPAAMDHALLAQDETLAAEIVERSRTAAMNEGDVRLLRNWLGRLPGPLRRRRFGLLMAEAAAAYESFELGTLDSILEFVDELEESPEQSFGTLVLSSDA